MNIPLNAHFLSTDSNREIQRNIHWELIVQGLSADIHMAIVAAPKIGLTINPIEVKYGASSVWVAGDVSQMDGDLVAYDYIKVDMEKALSDWFSQAYNSGNGAIGWASEYKRSAIFRKYGPGVNKPYKREWQVDGLWGTSIDIGEYTKQGGAEVVQITMAMKYDNCTIIR